MPIDRHAPERGLLDLSRVTTGKRIAPIHPGRVLRDEFLEPLGLSPYRLAKDIRVPPNRVTAILAGTRAVSADTALRLGRYFSTSPEFWLGLQESHDLDVARRKIGRVLPRITPRPAPSAAA